MPGWTQLAVTLAPISLRRSASALVCRTLASLDSAYALVGSYGLLVAFIGDVSQSIRADDLIHIQLGSWIQIDGGEEQQSTQYIFLRVTRSR